MKTLILVDLQGRLYPRVYNPVKFDKLLSDAEISFTLIHS